MKNDAPFSSKDLQLGHAVRRGLVRYIKRAHQRVKKQKPKMRNPAGLALTSKSGVADCSLAFAGTLVASVFFLIASSVAVVAVELVDPHAVLEQTRRDLVEFDKRMQRYKAERRKEEKELAARQKREEAERREREKAEMALAETRRKRDSAEQHEKAERQKREAQQEAQRQRDAAEEQKRAIAAAEQEARQKQEQAEREKTKEALQESQRQREAAAKAIEAQERGAASKQPEAKEEKTKEAPKQREGLRGMLSNRVDRRSACQRQADERGLTGRKASRYTRLCVYRLPIPKTLSR